MQTSPIRRNDDRDRYDELRLQFEAVAKLDSSR